MDIKLIKVGQETCCKTRKYIFLTLLPIIMFVLVCFGLTRTASAQVMECADEKLSCDANRGEFCASHTSIEGQITEVESRCSEFQSGQCNVKTENNCTACQKDVVSYPVQPKPYIFDQYVRAEYFGCKNGYACVIRSDVNLFDCVSEALACAGGRGVDSNLMAIYCEGADEVCTHKTLEVKDEEYFEFLAMAQITVTRNDEWTTPGGEVVIKQKAKVYCLYSGDTIVPESCFLENDRFLVHKTDETTLGFIANVYSQNDQAAIVANFRPHYGCGGGGWTGWARRRFWSFFNSTIGTLVALINGLLMVIVVAVLGFLLWFVGAFLDWVIAISTMDLAIIDTVWAFIRDFANMFFILILLYIAFCIILRIQAQNIKKMLPTFFAAVLLVNFSKMFCQLVIDFTNMLATTFYNMRPAGVRGLVGFVFETAGVRDVLGTDNLTGKTELKDLLAVVGSQWLSAIFMLVALLTYGAAAIILAIRIVILWLLTAIAPLVYLAWAAGVKKLVSQYWTTFLRTAFCAPAITFTMMLSVVVMSQKIENFVDSRMGTPDQMIQREVSYQKYLADMGAFNNFVQFMFGIAFMISGIYVCNKGGVIGAKFVVGGAEKLFRRTAGYVTGIKPAAKGIRALGGYGWRKGLEAPRLGGVLKYFDKKTWQEALERRKKVAARKARVDRIPELQKKIAGAEAWFFGGGTGAKMEDLAARAGHAKDIKAIAGEVAEGDATTEELIDIAAEKLKQKEKKGQLGTEGALDAEIEALLTVVLSRGDINDLLKSKVISSMVGHDLAKGGRAVEGADAKLIHRLFGDTGRAIDFANRVSEGSKRRYTHFAYMTTHDDEEHQKLTTAEPEDSDLHEIDLGPGGESRERRMQHDTNAMRRYFALKAQRLRMSEAELRQLFYMGMEYEGRELNNLDNLHAETKEAFNEKIEELPSIQKAKEEGATPEEIAKRIDEIRQGAATVVDTYHQQRNRAITSENLKQPARIKLGGHSGGLFQDAARASFTAAEREFYKIDTLPSDVKYIGRTPTTRGKIESMTSGDARRVLSWADPRTIAAFKYAPNKKMLFGIVEEIRDEGQKARAAGREDQAASIEKRAGEIEANLKELYENLERRRTTRTPPAGGGTGEGAPPEGGGGGGGGSQLFVAPRFGPPEGMPYEEWQDREEGRASPPPTSAPSAGPRAPDLGEEMDDEAFAEEQEEQSSR